MSERVAGRGPIEDRPAELSAIAADDALLDALGRGEPAADDDRLAGLLAAWRADLDDDLPGEFELPDDLDLDETAELPARVSLVKATAAAEVATVTPIRRPRKRMRRFAVGIAAGAVLIAGVGIGANRAGPDSPLWPVAQALYPEHAEVRLAEHRIGLARAAVADGRYADARQWLARASASVDRIRDQRTAQRLRAEIEELRRSLPPEQPVTGPSAGTDPSPGSTPAPTAPPAPPPGGGGDPGGGQPGGGDPGGDPGGGVPNLPIPVPTVPIPVPTVPPVVPTVPPVVPTLPIPVPTLPIPVPTLPI
jgi:hypothetical protein